MCQTLGQILLEELGMAQNQVPMISRMNMMIENILSLKPEYFLNFASNFISLYFYILLFTLYGVVAVLHLA